jgi:hypothetical protein
MVGLAAADMDDDALGHCVDISQIAPQRYAGASSSPSPAWLMPGAAHGLLWHTSLRNGQSWSGRRAWWRRTSPPRYNRPLGRQRVGFRELRPPTWTGFSS